MQKIYFIRHMQVSVFLFMTLFVISSCEPDDLSKPVRVNFEINFIVDTSPLSYLNFKSIVMDVDQIGFYGIRQEGDDVLFNTRPGDSFGMHILTPAQNSSYITYFDLKQGVYQMMRWDIDLGEIDDEVYPDDFVDSDDFGLIIEGTYTRLDGSTVLLFFAIEEETIRVESVNSEGVVPIPIITDNIYTVFLEINFHAIMRNIPRSLLEQAETDDEDDFDFIEISEDENEELYNLILFQLSKTLKAVVR